MNITMEMKENKHFSLIAGKIRAVCLLQARA